MEDENSFTGSFSKKEIKENGDRVLHFYYHIGGYTVEALPEHGYKINSIDGDNCYKYTYRYAVPIERMRIVSDGEEGLEGKITEYLEYGNVRFAKAEADGQSCLLKVEPGFKADRVKVAFDRQDVSVYSTRIDMKIC